MNGTCAAFAEALAQTQVQECGSRKHTIFQAVHIRNRFELAEPSSSSRWAEIAFGHIAHLIRILRDIRREAFFVAAGTVLGRFELTLATA